MRLDAARCSPTDYVLLFRAAEIAIEGLTNALGQETLE